MAPDLEIRPYQSGDETSIVEGWNAIFPDQDDLPTRDAAYWSWQFRGNTVGRTEVAVAVADGRVVGQYASVPQRAVDEGESITVGLIVDAFVLPEYRRSGPRPGPIIHLARELHDCFCGPRARLLDRGHSLLYGYPVPIWRIAQRYLASEMVRDMDVLFREVQTADARAAPGGIVVEEVSALDTAGDEVWAAAAGDVRFGLVRDSAYLEWRYARHPQKRYTVYVAREEDSGAARGIAVYGHGRYSVDGVGIVCDWVVPVADEAAEDALLHALEARARSDCASALVCVFPQPDARFLRWQRKGYLVGAPSHFLVMNTFQHHVRYLRDRWFFTLGDSDLV